MNLSKFLEIIRKYN